METLANFDFLSSNVFYQDQKDKHIFTPYKIIKKGNVTLGFIGLASNPPVLLENLKVKNPVDTYKKVYKEIKDQCDYVIAVIALNSTDEYSLISSDIKTDLIISANQYRYSKYLNNEKGYIYGMTDNEGKKIMKISGLVEDKTKTFGNASYLQYSYMINNKRLDRYKKIAGDKTIDEHYKDQAKVLKTVNNIRKRQVEISNDIEVLKNPLTLEVIEIEINTKMEETVKEKMDQYKELLKSLDK